MIANTTKARDLTDSQMKPLVDLVGARNSEGLDNALAKITKRRDADVIENIVNQLWPLNYPAFEGARDDAFEGLYGDDVCSLVDGGYGRPIKGEPGFATPLSKEEHQRGDEAAAEIQAECNAVFKVLYTYANPTDGNNQYF